MRTNTLMFPEVVTKMQKMGRKMRRPVHSFNIEFRPFELQPFMIAPVLPGETMKNLLVQARTVTDPIANPLMGWWNGFYFFYVKLRDLDGRTDFMEMFVNEGKSLAAYNTAAKTVTYHAGGTPDWIELCLKRITEEYFRDEGQAWNTWVSNGLPLAGVQRPLWIQSAQDDAAYIAPDVTVEGPDVDTNIEASEIEIAMRRWEMLKFNNLTDMSYEDYLMSHGIKVPNEDQNIPELIRYVEQWTYPTNTIDPTSGAPRSAASWAITERADKDRFFREPGFVVGVQCIRPKVQLRNLDGAGVSMLLNAYSWLPALLSDDPWTSVRKFADGAPLTISSDTGGYWVDVKDLFIYGDQFRNYVNTDLNKNILALPDATLDNKKYPATTDIDNLFVTKTAGTGKVRTDGVVNLAILSRLSDTTPGRSIT
jgi:hypothetical protein